MKKLVVSPGQAAEPGDRDQQVDVDRALAGDGAAEEHHGLAGHDEPDEGAGLGEGEDADQQVGPGPERVRDVFEQLLRSMRAELAAEAGSSRRDDRDGDRDQRQRLRLPPAALPRQLHRCAPSLADDRVVAVEPRAGGARGAPRSSKRPKAVGPEPVRSASWRRRSRRASSASPISGRSERAAGSRSLTSSSA